jgi:hypothetical protein
MASNQTVTGEENRKLRSAPKPRVQQPWELEPTPDGFRIPPPPPGFRGGK